MIRGGIRAVRTVISYPKSPVKPKVHATPIDTTSKVISVALNDRKNKKKITPVTKSAPKTNSCISSIVKCFI